jgi:hypothetical protein
MDQRLLGGYFFLKLKIGYWEVFRIGDSLVLVFGGKGQNQRTNVTENCG